MERLVLACLLSWMIIGCEQQSQAPTLTIAINPWPGYELLYLAEKKGFLAESGANVKLSQLSSLADAQRSYLNGRADGFTSTMIEAVQANFQSQEPLQVVMVPDYSNGGDIIIARSDIQRVADLKGKTVGCEIHSLGIYMLYKALEKHGLSLSDVNIRNVEQLEGEQALLNGTIDAFVTYPPVSVKMLQYEGQHKIFDSSEIPFEVIDTVSVRTSVLQEHPKLPRQLRRAWDKALQYMLQNPEDAYQIMAEREGISTVDFVAALEDIEILDSEEQRELFAEPQQLLGNAMAVCLILNEVTDSQYPCENTRTMVWQQ